LAKLIVKIADKYKMTCLFIFKKYIFMNIFYLIYLFLNILIITPQKKIILIYFKLFSSPK